MPRSTFRKISRTDLPKIEGHIHEVRWKSEVKGHLYG